MAKRLKLRMTNADYVAIAISPALIMALVGSLVFFLIEVLYVGQYQARLNYVFALFVFATVLIGRIAIEMGADRAALYALPLGLAMFLVLAKFVPHASPYSHLINLALLGVVWWSAHKLTWDCTLIDDNEDASGEGLMQRIGADELLADDDGATNATENELLTEDKTQKSKAPHTPGLWVLYFSLAALPLFGIGQKWIPASDVGRRQYAFGLLTVYVAAGLTLLVTTSFLGLRRYLRQRRVEMPGPMAATWVVTGAVLIAVVMLLAALIPRPQAEYAISQAPWQVRSPSDLTSSRVSFGDEGTEEDNADARQVMNDETDPNATATREGDEPTTTSDQAEKQSDGGQTDNGESESSQQQRDSSEAESSQTPQRDQQQSDGQESSGDSTGERPSASEQQEASPSEENPAPESESSQDSSQSVDEPTSNSATQSVRSPRSPVDILPVVGGLTGVLKLAVYAALGLALAYLAWRHRQQIAHAIREFVQQIRDFLAQLFGVRAKPTSDVDSESEESRERPARPFSSYSDLFATGRYRAMPPEEVVRYTFEAFEAWARERGYPRSADQTPAEFVRQALPGPSPIATEALQLARLYNEAAYAPGSIGHAAVECLGQLWKRLRESAQTPLEPAS